MIQSMTGFGRAVAGDRLRSVTVEIRSINHRYFECSVQLPNVFSDFEDDIRKTIQTQLVRGKIVVSISISGPRSYDEKLAVDEEKLKDIVETLQKTGRRLRLNCDLSLKELLAFPYWFSVEKKVDDSRSKKLLYQALSLATKRLMLMRSKEGCSLKKDLSMRAGKIIHAIEAIDRLSKKAPEAYREQLIKRIKMLDEAVTLDPDRLAREVAIQAEHLDITEEIVRAKHHLEVLLRSLEATGEVGKKLDFVLQEIHREVNTMASKAESAQVSEQAIVIKSELEKIREQIHNIV